ncbi:MAG: sulfate ABC transporter permease subunit CysT [Candidatus Accumulibacter sp.]|jgi:sulfate transport system permease protein|nr:sulfate ABC transporter permease subunit CysT [Accumulibacter sp.]
MLDVTGIAAPGAWAKTGNTSLPGFGLTLGLSLTYLSLLLVIPLAALALYTARLSLPEYWAILADERVSSAFCVSFLSAGYAAVINGFFGFIIAWALTRYAFFGRKLIDALIDLPFAIPTAVAGISLAVMFSPNGILGKILMPLGIEIAFSKAGIVIALIFIGLPFVVRTVQPVIRELDREVEEAAMSLGANFAQRFFKVIFPSILPALLTGVALSFARGVGEYATIIFISSNMPYETEIVPLLIVKKLLQFDYVGASALGSAMLILAFLLLLVINLLQSWMKRDGNAA